MNSKFSLFNIGGTFFAMLVIGAISACATPDAAKYYQDPELPDEELAMIPITTAEGFNLIAKVLAVDKKPISFWDLDMVAKMEPGVHEIVVAAMYRDLIDVFGFRQVSVELSADLMANCKYRARVVRNKLKFRVWIEDDETKEPIAVGTIVHESGT